MLALLTALSTAACKQKEIQEPPAEDTAELTAPDTPDKVEVDTEPMLKEAVAALNSLESIDLPSGGITVASTTSMVHVPDNESTHYNAALVKRNKMFEKKYNTTLIQYSDTSEGMLENAYKYMMAGVYYADIFSITQRDLSKFAARGLLMKTTSVIDADFSREFYDQAMMEQATQGKDSYGIYGAFNKDISSYYCLYVNRDVLKAAGLEMPYAKVRSGEWTWDELIAMMRAGATLDSKAEMSVVSQGLLTSSVYKSAGLSYVNTGYDKTPGLAYENPETAKVLATLRTIGGYDVTYQYTVEGSSARAEFMKGNTMFYIGTVSDMPTVTTMSSDWCILPLPKLRADAETYYSYVSPSHTVTAVFAGARCYDMAAALDGLNAASYGDYLTNAYYYELIDTAIRDSSALDMMDYICGIKGGKAINDFTDLYPEAQPYTVEALAEGIYDSALTVRSVFESSKYGFDDLFSK